MSTDWDSPVAPTGPLAPGLKLDPHQPNLEMEKTDFVEPDPQSLDQVEDLRAQNKRLMQDNKVLMDQIEQTWAIIKARDKMIQILQEQPQAWNR